MTLLATTTIAAALSLAAVTSGNAASPINLTRFLGGFRTHPGRTHDGARIGAGEVAYASCENGVGAFQAQGVSRGGRRLERQRNLGRAGYQRQQCRSHASAAGRGGVRGDAEPQVQSQLCRPRIFDEAAEAKLSWPLRLPSGSPCQDVHLIDPRVSRTSVLAIVAIGIRHEPRSPSLP